MQLESLEIPSGGRDCVCLRLLVCFSLCVGLCEEGEEDDEVEEGERQMQRQNAEE